MLSELRLTAVERDRLGDALTEQSAEWHLLSTVLRQPLVVELGFAMGSRPTPEMTSKLLMWLHLI